MALRPYADAPVVFLASGADGRVGAAAQVADMDAMWNAGETDEDDVSEEESAGDEPSAVHGRCARNGIEVLISHAG